MTILLPVKKREKFYKKISKGAVFINKFVRYLKTYVVIPKEGLPVHWQIDGFDIEIKYPGKMFWHEEGLTKLDLVTYYKKMASIMMPYLEGRPVTLHYFPQGIHGISFYKRDFKSVIPGLVETFPYHEISQNKIINVPVVVSRAGIIYLASKACVEFHTWASKIADILHPTWAVFDLDIDMESNFQKVLEAADLINEYLSSLGIKSFVKTSGGSGMHILVPLTPEYEFKVVKDWVKQVGVRMQNIHPGLFAMPGKSNKTHETGKVVIDYRQNIITRNTASVYTVRAKKGATVSTPVTWDEVKNNSFMPADFNLKTVPQRVEEKGDLFKELLELKQKLPGIK